MSDSFESLLARAERRDHAPRGACPDAGVLAAYLDGTLSPGERAGVEAHAADCARCTLQLATIVRLEDESGHPRHAPRSWKWRRVGWLLPAATAVVLAGIYMALPSRAPSSAPAPAERRMAERTIDPPAEPATSRAKEADAPPPPRIPPSAAAVASPSRPDARDTDAGGNRTVEEYASRREHADALTSTDEAGVPSSPPPAERVERDRTRAPAGDAAKALPAPLRVSSPDGSVQWRVSPAGIERSTDSGRTWQVEHAPATPGITMGAAPSADVCWLATRLGTVLRRTQDATWADVSPRPPSVVMRLESTSDLTATLITPGGTRLKTTDGGQTWSRDEPVDGGER